MDEGQFRGDEGFWIGNTGAGLVDIRQANVQTSGPLFMNNEFANDGQSWHHTRAWNAVIQADQGAFSDNRGKIGTISMVGAHVSTKGKAFCDNENLTSGAATQGAGSSRHSPHPLIQSTGNRTTDAGVGSSSDRREGHSHRTKGWNPFVGRS